MKRLLLALKQIRNKFYQKYEFQLLDKPYIETEHFGCDVWYIKDVAFR